MVIQQEFQDLGILVVLPFSPITIPYLIRKSKEFNIDIVPKWYKTFSKDEDILE